MQGVPKSARNQATVYKNLGSINSPRFGEKIGEGSEQSVYIDNSNPNRVLKVYSDLRFDSLNEIREFKKGFSKRNRIPFAERNVFEGYIKNVDGSYSPVYSQERLSPLSKPID